VKNASASCFDIRLCIPGRLRGDAHSLHVNAGQLEAALAFRKTSRCRQLLPELGGVHGYERGDGADFGFLLRRCGHGQARLETCRENGVRVKEITNLKFEI